MKEHITEEMDEKKEKAAIAANSSSAEDKVTKNNLIKQRVRHLFRNGMKVTALQINDLCGTNDARKIISDLRKKEGWNIQDMRLPNQCKLYWLVEDFRQLSLFE